MSTFPNDGGPAFPVQTIFNGHGEATNTGQYWDGNGMTLRDYFAAAALGGLISHPEQSASFNEIGAKLGVTPSMAVACTAYDFADAMIARRAQTISSTPAPIATHP